ncbi:patatin-like phospholipase family protein [Polynucleobacter sp. MWH-UH23A]|uniref:patatin-like phospholipase family protein n=1 Tax=Polynucleobacter sp. MWH-UH23A TaxID=1855613 RepID=UPI003364BAB1
MTQSSRRAFLKTSAIGATGLVGSAVNAQSTPSKEVIEQVKALEAQKELDSTSTWKDDLAHPIPYKNRYAQGKERGLALGGGGMPLIAWYAGYFTALKKNGIDLSNADVLVGTSAGSVMAAMLKAGHLWRLADEIGFFAEFPKLLEKMMPAVELNPSQKRAIHLDVTAKDASPATIQAIGKAAMAALNLDGVAKYYEVTKKLLTSNEWPNGVFTTANDCYTGQRIVVSKTNNIPINVACAASSSLPGQLGPTFLKNRLCMDGGICQTSTHGDVIAGVKRAIIISLGDGTINEQRQGLRTSTMPNTVNEEVKDLEAAGTKTKHIVVGLPPGISKVENLIDPKWIAPFLKYGNDRGIADTQMIKVFWG